MDDEREEETFDHFQAGVYDGSMQLTSIRRSKIFLFSALVLGSMESSEKFLSPLSVVSSDNFSPAPSAVPRYTHVIFLCPSQQQ